MNERRKVMATEYSFSFNNENCIQCYGCEVACRSWRGLELGVKWRSVKNIWIGQYPKVKNTSISVACMHCADPVCVDACPSGALKKRAKDGIVVVDRGKCTGCKTCLEVCPYNVPVYGVDGKMQKCDLCVHEIDHDREFPPCVETCPTQALQLVKMYPREKKKEEQRIKKLIAM
jgi:anaerobic dimethyl sulfoxide reductase subunit B (iron-sulfur subunit)